MVVVVRSRNRPLVLGRLLLGVTLRADVSVLVSAAFFSVLRLDVLEIEILLSEALGGGVFKMLATTSNLWLCAGVALVLDLDVDAVDGLVVVVVVAVEFCAPNLGRALSLLTVLAVGFCVVAAVVLLGASV